MNDQSIIITSAITILLVFLLCCNLNAQAVITGKVTDSLNVPLSNSSLIAKPQDSTLQARFAVTDETGFYKLVLDREAYTVTARYLGYKSYAFNVDASNEDITRDILLEYQSESLDEVILEMPVTVKEDSIIYNVDDFVTGEERKLKDVLQKLPGVEVDKNGNIYVQGKKASTFMVENKKFFGGDSKLGVENIPADAIEKVEALDNYNEIAFLKDLDNKDELAINIKLKEGKKNFVFGNLEAGKGNQDFYSANSNLYYYSKKTSVNSIANLNNIREQTFTYSQYSSFKGGLNSVFSGGSTVFEESNNDLLQFIENEDVLESRRQFGALNVFHEASTKLNLSGYGIFSNTDERSLNRSINSYNTFTEERSISQTVDNHLAIGQLKASYVPNLTDRLDFKTQFKYSDNNLQDLTNSAVDSLENTYAEQLGNTTNYFNQIVEWHKKKSKKHRFSFGASYTYEDGNLERLRQTSDDILQGLIPIEDEDTIRLRQPKSIKSQRLKAILKHYWIIDRDNHLYTTLGGFLQDYNYRTRDFQVLQDGTINDFAPSGFGNDLSFDLINSYLGLYYKHKLGDFTFGQGIFLHNYDWNVDQDTDFTKNKWVLLPEVSIEYEFSDIKEVSFDYALQSNFVSAENYADRFLIGTYNSLFRGVGSLENELTHSLSLSFNKYSTFRGFGYYIIASYRIQQDGVQRAVSTQDINQTLSPVFLENPAQSWRLNGRLYRRVSKVKLSLGLGYDKRDFDQILNNTTVKNANTSWNYRLNARTSFKKWPTINLGFSQSFTEYSLGGRSSEFVTTIPSISIDYDFLDGFIASIDYSANIYENKQLNQRNSYSLSKASLFYAAKNSPWSFEVEANNLFDVEFKNENLVTSYLISDNQSFILPRILLFSVGYRL